MEATVNKHLLVSFPGFSVCKYALSKAFTLENKTKLTRCQKCKCHICKMDCTDSIAKYTITTDVHNIVQNKTFLNITGLT
jgi:hypothetical protein